MRAKLDVVLQLNVCLLDFVDGCDRETAGKRIFLKRLERVRKKDDAF